MTKNHPELKACELKSCPFCDHPPKHTYVDSFTNNSIGCVNLDCEFQPCTNKNYSTKEAAIAAWNARPSPIIPEDAVTREDTVRISDRQKPTSSTGLEPVTEDALRQAVIHNDEHSVTLSRADSASLMNKALRNALNRSLIEKADGFLTGEIEWAVNYAQEWVRGATQGSEENKCLETLINHITKGKR